MKGFRHDEIEKSAQEKWERLELNRSDLSDESREPYYLLFEFPYPSGDLHIGHWYAFALTDIFARHLRQSGRNVLFPVGFDAFGLPAENAAIKHGANPREWTYQNMERMRTQMKSMGTSVDWSREVITCDPSYYKWTQWLFIKLMEQGLAERKEASVKWCPKDNTVLANEQVIDGACERCGTEVEEKRLTQWFMKITDYAERLLSDLDPLPWREDIKEAQRAWIGKSQGAALTFSIQDSDEFITVFTTRPDTVYGATYVVLAPEHALVESLKNSIRNWSEVDAYRAQTSRKTERERSEHKEETGVKLEGVMAINPATKEPIPVYLADYVLASYGTGAVMAVPAHDERDFEFAKEMSLDSINVIRPYPVSVGVSTVSETNATVDVTALINEKEERILRGEECYIGSGLLRNSGQFDGRENTEAMWDIVDAVGGVKTTNYRIRDWLVSRQRYWGCPIPVAYDPEGKPHPIPSEHLPWLLPEDVDFTLGGADSPLKTSKELKERVERIFGPGWTPEYDTLDTFVDSSWYFYRYLAPNDEHHFSDSTLMKKWIPVDRYSGGSEHTTMHLLYARFFHKALHDLALVPEEEPFIERFNRGLILGPDGQKMSKSKGNVVSPDDVVKEFGADAVRTYLAFIGPYNESGTYPWNLDGVKSIRAFLERIAKLKGKIALGEEMLRKEITKTLVESREEIQKFKYNTALAKLMTLVRAFERASHITEVEFDDLLTLIAPFAPHLAEHLYGENREYASIHLRPLPLVDESLLVEEVVEVAVQVLGKKRGEILVHPDAPEDEVVKKARSMPEISKYLEGKSIDRIIYVKGRILNFVVS